MVQLPLASLLTRFQKYPSPERDNEAGVFSKRDELFWQ